MEHKGYTILDYGELFATVKSLLVEVDLLVPPHKLSSQATVFRKTSAGLRASLVMVRRAIIFETRVLRSRQS